MANPSDLTGSYNTSLTPQQEAQFQQWRATLAANPQTSDLANLGDYDLRGAWLSNAQAASNGHLPDTWKKPNHITFSDGSIYANAQNPPGQWQQGKSGGAWTYNAPSTYTRYHTPDQLLNYFQVYENGKRDDGTYGTPNNVVLPNALRPPAPQPALTAAPNALASGIAR